MVLASIIDDVLVLALIILGLWLFHVEFTWWLILIVAAAIIAFIFVIHKAVVPSLLRREVSGAGGMIGLTGKVTESLKPAGMVKIRGEYWTAISVQGDCETGEDVEVMGIKGLNLEVRKKNCEQ